MAPPGFPWERPVSEQRDSEWLHYQLSVSTANENNRAATGWFAWAVVALVAAILSFLWAELHWDIASPIGTGGIGIGTSGYAAVLYQRAIALAALSAALAAIGIFRRERLNLLVSYRQAPR